MKYNKDDIVENKIIKIITLFGRFTFDVRNFLFDSVQHNSSLGTFIAFTCAMNVYLFNGGIQWGIHASGNKQY